MACVALRAFCRVVIFLLSVSRLYTRPGLSVFSFAAVCPPRGPAWSDGLCSSQPVTVERHVLGLGPTRSLVAIVDDPQRVTSKQTRALCFTMTRMQVRLVPPQAQ